MPRPGVLESVPASPVAEPDFEALRLYLARLRHERGWSLDELAARSGIGRSTLATLESGRSRRTPGAPATRGNLETWFRLAQAFDVELGALLQPLYGDGSQRG